MKTRLSEERINFLRENYSNMTYREMGENLGLSDNTVYYHCKRLGFLRSTGNEFNQGYFKFWSHNMAYLIGFIASDGSINGNRLQIQISEKDREFLERICNELEIKLGVRENKVVNAVYIAVSSRETIEDLKALGICEGKSKNGFTIDIPKKYEADFVRGYVDGDGSIYNQVTNGHIYARMDILSGLACENIIDMLSSMIERNTGVKPNKYFNEKKRSVYIRLSGKKMDKVCEWLYSTGDLRLERKYNKWKVYNEWLRNARVDLEEEKR